jgi:hypothetical protein
MDRSEEKLYRKDAEVSSGSDPRLQSCIGASTVPEGLDAIDGPNGRQ